MNILHAIGNTPMVQLRKVVPPNCADIFVKLEWENPTGSLKDRMAHAVISRAEEDGRLKPGDTVIEYTGGSTGTSLALVCAAKGYPLQIVSSDAFSREKLDHMTALGAQLTIVRSEGGLTTKKLILDMIEAARGLSQEPHTYWTDQLNNHDSIAGCRARGILRVAGRSGRASQDRRGWDWLHSSTLGAGSGGRDPVGPNGRREGDDEAYRAGGGPLRGDVVRSERRRRDSGSRAAGA
jgi:hypothetical protein